MYCNQHSRLTWGYSRLTYVYSVMFCQDVHLRARSCPRVFKMD
jgi:hypothetical protein